MEANFNIHDDIIPLLNGITQNKIIDELQKGEYFFSFRKVSSSEVKIWKRRISPMRDYPDYKIAVINMENYFENGGDSIWFCEFILEYRSYYIFFETLKKQILGMYDTPFVTMKKIIALNEEYKKKGVGIISYEKKNALA